MSKVCIITGRATAVGNNVSHANNRTKRVFFPNLQNASFFSDKLGKKIHFRISARGIRTIEFHGGLDGFLLTTRNTKLHPALKGLKKEILKKV